MIPSIARLREVLELDIESGSLRWRTSRGRVKAGALAQNQHGTGYLRVRVDGRLMFAHRVVFAMVNGYWPEQVDHIDGNRANNRPCNLRAATNAENSRNARRRFDSASGVKGVTWDRCAGKWQAQCTVDGHVHTVGRFHDIADAAAAVRAFRERKHGEFACHGTT